jgi:hypothetical protein
MIRFLAHPVPPSPISKSSRENSGYRLNMELDLLSLLELLCTAVLIGRDLATLPLPPHLGSNTRALLVSQDRRHLFVNPEPGPIGSISVKMGLQFLRCTPPSDRGSPVYMAKSLIKDMSLFRSSRSLIFFEIESGKGRCQIVKNKFLSN